MAQANTAYRCLVSKVFFSNIVKGARVSLKALWTVFVSAPLHTEYSPQWEKNLSEMSISVFKPYLFESLIDHGLEFG